MIDVISLKDNKEFDFSNFKILDKDTNLKIYNLAEEHDGLGRYNGGIRTIVHKGTTPLRFFKQDDKLYILDPDQYTEVG